MKGGVLKCIGLGLGLQGWLWGDFCDVCGMDHKIGQCPVETLKLHLEEFDVDDWDSDVEEAFVQEHELVAQCLRKVRKWHHYQSLQKKVAKLDWEPLDIALINAALLEKSDCLLNEIKSMDLALLKQRESDVAELDMDMVRGVELLLEEENERLEAEQKRQAELRRQQEEEDRKRREEEQRRLAEQQRLERERFEWEEAERIRKAEEERKRREEEQRRLAEQQRLERERFEWEEAERIRKAEEERRRLEEEARRPRGFTGQQIIDRAKILYRDDSMKVSRADQMKRAKKIQHDATYLNLNQLDSFFHEAFKALERENE